MFNSYTHFHVDSKLFPESTRKALPTALMIKQGALPLGYKTEKFLFRKKIILNLGLLNPSTAELSSLKEAAKKNLGPEAFSEIHLYKIDPEDFIRVLESHYGVKRESLEGIEESETSPTLRQHILLEKNLL